MNTAKLIIVILMLLGVGCRSETRPAANTDQRRVMSDDLGRTVSIPTKITRAVSLAPDLTENIFAVGAGERLVGVTSFCNYPEGAKAIAKVGDTMNPNIETIIALKPDVVFVSTASQIEAFLKTLEQNGIAVYVANPRSLFDVFKNLERFGELFETTDRSAELVAGLKERATAVASVTEGELPVRVFLQISREPLFTIGKASFLTEMIQIAAAHSVTADVETAYPKLSKETAIALDPEAIILSDSEDNREPNEVFRNSKAVKTGRVFRIDPDLISRPAPRLVDALERIARDLHPSKFRAEPLSR